MVFNFILFLISVSFFESLRLPLAKGSSTFSPSPSSIVFTTPSVPLVGDRNLRKRGCNRPTRCYFCPTCPSPAGGSLIPNQAFPLTIKGKDVTALQCCLFRSTPSLLSQGGLHRFPQAPFPSGDRGCNRPPVLRTASL